jgi:predicted transcriptional regulator
MTIKYTIQNGKPVQIIIADTKEEAIRDFKENSNMVISTTPIKLKSIKEFIIETKPNNSTEIVVIFGYYIENILKETSFTTKEISKMFITAKIKKPKNISDTITNAMKNGLIMEVDNKKNKKKAYTLTQTGEKFVKEMNNRNDRK